jgi:enolase-phosphatase E1
MFDPAQISTVLLDIEGTTTPISFVLDVLFPYASRNVEAFLKAHHLEPGIQRTLQTLRTQFEIDGWDDTNSPDEVASLAAYARHLMSQDSKFPALKSLQGEIWQDGYKSGELRGQVFDDVPVALRRWREQGKLVFIYSSGSVLAQKLIFGHTNHGDLTPLLDGYFDTAVGVKSDPPSYRHIASEIKTDAAKILFISDATRELEAARSAGMHVMLSSRPGNPPAPTRDFESIRSFDELSF